MATILPNGETTFFDNNGEPLAGGSVSFYLPGTTTPKDTWQDASQIILNTNPITLDSSGRAIIYGSGSYRQIVRDQDDNTIWDTVTGEASAGGQSFGGTSSGTANAQIISAGVFDGSDGATIVFTAGVTNTGATTLSVGGGSPISILKNGPTGPVDLVAGDIASGNIYSVVYSTSLASFQLLQSIPPALTYASQPEAQAGTGNTQVMTPLRTAQQINQPRASIASATTTDLGTVTSPNIFVTGTTGIVSFGTTADEGTFKRLTFQQTLVLAYNPVSMILPNGTKNISTDAGDTCVAIALGSGNWQVISYQRRSGTARPPYVSGQQTPHSGSSINLTHNLGVVPSNVVVDVVIQGVAAGYPSGTIIQLGTVGQGGFSVEKDENQLSVNIASSGIYVVQNGGGVIASLSDNDYRVIVRAFP